MPKPMSEVVCFLASICTDAGNTSLSEKTINWLIQTKLAAAVLYYTPEKDIPPVFVSQLKAEELSAKFWYQSQFSSAMALIAELNAHNITPTLLKGLSVSTQYYPEPYFRAMRDIDLLVTPQDIEQVEKLMPHLDYVQRSNESESFYKSHHHTMPWQHTKNETWFEIHKKLFSNSLPHYSETIFGIDSIHKNKYPDTLQYKDKTLNVYRLDPELQLVYITAHWARSFKRTGGLFAFIDTALIINKATIDWEKLYKLSNDPYIANYIFILFSLLIKHRLVKNEAAKEYIKKLKHSIGAERYIINYFISAYLFTSKPFGRILTENNVKIFWRLLFRPIPSAYKFFLLPVYLLFPPNAQQKFSLRFQLSRIGNALFKSSE